MKVAINLLLTALIFLLIYMIYTSIREPIAFQEEKGRRVDVVIARLKQIKTSQEIYRSIKGNFAGSFEELINVLKTDKIPFEKIENDPSDPTNEDKFIRSTSYAPAIDTINAMGINLDSIPFVPFTSGQKFEIAADTIEYQNSKVPVVQVGTKWKVFMGPFGDAKYKKYDKYFDPEKMLKFGDLTTPNLNGNWE
ncbi:MAG: hypothetical protein IPN73_13060 [Saprospiraceae bacterium]|nr:hypothetical protein [Saprospiraceae bacterium]MBK7789650.1 hypothetical protein [Saprospiraceae bacterium]MBK8112289.1 hypothetical protein [Saprospiraceae bacterium]MBK8851073.1 hypothetical protein [Saprospiraceae bacterium]MBK9689031.1 hypothetical protein [Saprospiraceae bacterium]